MFRNALAALGILGIEPRAKDTFLVQGVKVLVGQMVKTTPGDSATRTGPQDRLVRHAVTQLLDWHEQIRPAV